MECPEEWLEVCQEVWVDSQDSDSHQELATSRSHQKQTPNLSQSSTMASTNLQAPLAFTYFAFPYTSFESQFVEKLVVKQPKNKPRTPNNLRHSFLRLEMNEKTFKVLVCHFRFRQS